MNKTHIITLTCLLAFTGSAVAQTTKPAAPVTPVAAPATSTKPTLQVTVNGQWEYLVVSFGKTYFTSAADGDAKVSGSSKLLMYGPLGAVYAQEAQVTQAQIDTLGRYGWELLNVLGAIGGDQQWVFKRPYDPDRASKEAALIRQEGQLLVDARAKAAKEAAAQPVSPAATPQQLIELDARDAAARKAADDAALASRVSAALQPITGVAVTIDTSNIGTTLGGDGGVLVTLDLTSNVLSGNTYRATAVQAALKAYIASVASSGRFNMSSGTYYSSFCVDGGINFHLVGTVQFNGAARSVGASGFCAKLQ